MRTLLLIIVILSALFACGRTGKNEQGNHRIVVDEVIQVSGYTYLRAQEDGKEIWVASTPVQAKAGEVYYYDEGLTMTNFESRELNRTFPSIVFVQKLTGETPVTADGKMISPGSSKSNIEKISLNIEKAPNGLSVAELYAGKENLAGKKVVVRGAVTKFSPGIMDKNWIHIQDGTETNGKFDLTLTSSESVNAGDTITFEATVTLNKDLGYGYFFDVLLEEAKVVGH